MTNDELLTLVSELEAKLVDPSLLDEVVQDRAALIASDINDEGLHSQVKYLTSSMREKDARALLANLLGILL